jgi:hypothetical protein
MNARLYVASVFLNSTRPRHVFVWLEPGEAELWDKETHDRNGGEPIRNVIDAQRNIRVIVANRIRRHPQDVPKELMRITELPYQTITNP